MINPKLWFVIVSISFLMSCSTIDGSFDNTQSFVELPKGWKQMEVEAKWETTRSEFERAIIDLSDGTTAFGYSLDVRWGGVPRKFIDHYYDTPSGVIRDATHSLRHRTRLRSNPNARSRKLSELINSNWQKDWERIQYKSTPVRRGSVWFRHEVGECKIWDSMNQDLCADLATTVASDVLQDVSTAHPATSLLLTDHPNLDRTQLSPVVTITDFRYRIEFKRDEVAVLEASMDHLISENLRTGEVNFNYEIELEVITDTPSDMDMIELFRVADLLQRQYNLTPSIRSKGGNYVPESGR